MRQQPFASPEEALAHYGVKGMRWGVRKKEETGGQETGGQTPSVKIDARTSTGKVAVVTASGKVPALSERQKARVDKFMKKSEVMDAKISELRLENEKLGRSKPYTQKVNNDTIRNLESAKARALKDAEATKRKKLTSTQKKAIVGAVVVGGLIAYTAYARGSQSGALNSYQLLAQQRLTGSKTPFAVNKELTGKMTAKQILDKVVKPVNPGYASPGGQMNCRRSTFAYELRRRGFDVHATTSMVGWGQSESGVINATTPGKRNFYRSLSMSRTVVDKGRSARAPGDTRENPVTKLLLDNLNISPGVTSNHGSKKVFEALGKQPNGSRGEVLFKFPNFGHSMAYEVINGKPHVFDSQKGTYHDLTKTVESKWGNFHGAEITRLDNLDLDLKFLTRWADNN